MELMKFLPQVDPTYGLQATILTEAKAIDGYKSATWTERYYDPGEFIIEAPLSSDLMSYLPLGTIIGNAQSLDVMIVESHEISEEFKSDPQLKISGRSFETALENKLIGQIAGRHDTVIGRYPVYTLPADYTWNQAYKLINDHINNWGDVYMAYDNLINVVAGRQITTGKTGVRTVRTPQAGDVLSRVSDILAIDDLGLKTVRRNNQSGADTGHTDIVIYDGVNRASTVRFSWKGGDLDSSEYLFSDKKLKNVCLVQGKWMQAFLPYGPHANYFDERMMTTKADDLDERYANAAAAEAAWSTGLSDAFTTRALEAIAKQNRVHIARTDIKDTNRFKYRTDYDVGDLVTLEDNFGQSAIMRVSEYVEIDEVGGSSGHPTLSLPLATSG